MSIDYRAYFGLKGEPFCAETPTKDLLRLPGMLGVKSRMEYALQVGGAMVVTGDVGSGKSTSLRWSCAQFHPSQTCIVSLVASGGGLMEFLRSISLGLGLGSGGQSRTRILADIKSAIRDLATTKKQKVLVVIDEANLLRSEVFAELHTLTQFDYDSKILAALVLCGQEALLEKLQYRSTQPLTSRVVGRIHLTPLSRSDMEEYVHHHLSVAGTKKRLFEDAALLAIFQGSGGLLRKANALARGGLLAAAQEKKEVVVAEHIRLAQSEIL